MAEPAQTRSDRAPAATEEEDPAAVFVVHATRKLLTRIGQHNP